MEDLIEYIDTFVDSLTEGDLETLTPFAVRGTSSTDSGRAGPRYYVSKSRPNLLNILRTKLD